MNKILIFAILLVLNTLGFTPFCYALSMDCRVGESILERTDFKVEELNSKDEFFKNVALKSIEELIKKQPFDQNGVTFKLSVTGSIPSLIGYFVVKERADQLDLSEATCSTVQGNNKGFTFDCVVTNPNDYQKVFFSITYKYGLSSGVLELRVSKSELGLLTKNKISCLAS